MALVDHPLSPDRDTPAPKKPGKTIRAFKLVPASDKDSKISSSSLSFNHGAYNMKTIKSKLLVIFLLAATISA